MKNTRPSVAATETGVATTEKGRKNKRQSNTKKIPKEEGAAVEEALETVWQKLGGESSKPSVADLIRLLQLRKELNADKPGNITVRWVEDCDQTPKEE